MNIKLSVSVDRNLADSKDCEGIFCSLFKFDNK